MAWSTVQLYLSYEYGLPIYFHHMKMPVCSFICLVLIYFGRQRNTFMTNSFMTCRNHIAAHNVNTKPTYLDHSTTDITWNTATDKHLHQGLMVDPVSVMMSSASVCVDVSVGA